MKNILLFLAVLIPIFSASCSDLYEIGFLGSPHSVTTFKDKLHDIYYNSKLPDEFFKSFASSHHSLEKYSERIKLFQTDAAKPQYKIPDYFILSFAASPHSLDDFKNRINAFDDFIKSKKDNNGNDDNNDFNYADYEYLCPAFARSSHNIEDFFERLDTALKDPKIGLMYAPNYAYSFYTQKDFHVRINWFKNDPQLKNTDFY